MAANPPAHDPPDRTRSTGPELMPSGPARYRRLILVAVALVAAVILFSVAPLFHLVPLRDTREQALLRAFHAGAFVEQFWTERLLPAADQAVDAALFIEAIAQDPLEARARFGRSLGLSETWYGFVAFTGRVDRVTSADVFLATTDSGAAPGLVIELGPVFGHAIRDGTGLLDVSHFPNSRDFNAISSEINRRVEDRVLPALRAGATPNAIIRVVGCVEVSTALAASDPLPLIPFVVQIP